MTLTGYIFIFIFFPSLVVLHTISKDKFRNIVLLFFNLIFILSSGKSVIFLFLSLITYYCSALLIQRISHDNHKKMIFLSTILINVSILIFFKYRGYILEDSSSLLNLVMPIGISFYTFQGISYLSDVYRKKQVAENNFIHFTIYFTLFLTITSGPIVRYSDFSPQLDFREVNESRVAHGIVRFSFGLIKKVYFASNFALIANNVYSNLYPSTFYTGTAWLGSISFMLQLYFDFSGYTDMVLGLGEVLGFNLPENFNAPYCASSYSDFWKRWHISLTKWFKENIYIPLGGNRKGTARTLLNMLIVWIITGIWHGTQLTFIAWGVFNYLILIFERYLLKDKINKIPLFLRHIITLIFINISWVFFRAENINQALIFIKKMLIFDFNIVGINQFLTYTLTQPFEWFIAIILCTPLLQRIYTKLYYSENKIKQSLSLLIGTGLFILAITFVLSTTFKVFIYQQF